MREARFVIGMRQVEAILLVALKRVCKGAHSFRRKIVLKEDTSHDAYDDAYPADSYHYDIQRCDVLGDDRFRARSVPVGNNPLDRWKPAYRAEAGSAERG